MKFDKPIINVYKRRIWLYDRGDYEKYRKLIRNVNWNELLRSTNLDNTADLIADIITDAASKSVPNKLATIIPNDIPWFNSAIRKLIRKRHRVHKRAKSLNNEYTWSKFRKIRNEVTNLIRKCKNDYKNKLIVQINDTKVTAKTMVYTC